MRVGEGEEPANRVKSHPALSLCACAREELPSPEGHLGLGFAPTQSYLQAEPGRAGLLQPKHPV